MLKYNNYKPKYLQITDGVFNSEPQEQATSATNIDESYNNAEFNSHVAQDNTAQYSPNYGNNNNYNSEFDGSSVDNSTEPINTSSKEMSNKARNYMKYAKTHDAKVQEILRKIDIGR